MSGGFPLDLILFAALALFLCRDEAAQVTGANWSVDGGWTAE